MKKNKTRFALLYEKTLERIIPKYGFFSVIFCFVFNSLIYTGTQIVISGARHFDLTTDADRAIPFIPAWAFVYLGCFLFWAVNYILMTHRKKEEWFQFAAGDYLSRMLCGVFFVLLPTTNIRPKVLGNSVLLASGEEKMCQSSTRFFPAFLPLPFLLPPYLPSSIT